MLTSAQRGGKPDIRSQAALASVAAAAGDVAEAQRILAVVAASGYMDHHVAYSVGAAYAQLRRTGRSMEWLERAAASGFSAHTWYARDPLLAPLRGSSRFSQFLDHLRVGSTGTRSLSR